MAAVSKLSVQVGEIAITITMGAPSLDDDLAAVLVKIEEAERAHLKKEELHRRASQLREENILQMKEEQRALQSKKYAAKLLQCTGISQQGKKWKAVGFGNHYIGMFDGPKDAADAVDIHYKSVDKIPKRGFNLLEQ